MPGIAIKAENNNYLFSVLDINKETMPDCGGVFVAVIARNHGLSIEQSLAIGSCVNFKKYANKIKNFANNRCTHIYIMPEFCSNTRESVLEELSKIEKFQETPIRMLEAEM